MAWLVPFKDNDDDYVLGVKKEKRMKSLLYGNGINIQFGGSDNTNSSIIIRAIREAKKTDFPNHIIIDDGELLLFLFGQLFLHFKMILNGEMDLYAISSIEKNELQNFKKRYNNIKSINIANVGFEDYYFIYDLVCHKYKIYNPIKYNVRQALKDLFIYSIYNKGKVNDIYKSYPVKLESFFKSYSNYFTTNYDKNIELFTGRTVYYLHGSFHIRNGIYNTDSLRNQIEDSPIDNCTIDETHYYLYSNALTTYSGDYKLSYIKQAKTANDVVERMTHAYNDDKIIKEEIDNWMNDPNQLVRKLGQSIIAKFNNPELQFPQTYPIKEFQSISDSLDIVGLSPYNDTHIFDTINENKKIKYIKFYYYNDSELKVVKSLLNRQSVYFENVSNLWQEYGV